MAKGFGGMPGNMQSILKEAQKMQDKIRQAQEQLKEYEHEAQAGGGSVRVKLNGKYQVISLFISPEVISSQDQEMLQDLITAAFNEAVVGVQQHAESEMGKIAGGLNIPGLV
jgi:nucleoid-associated protein EbfC